MGSQVLPQALHMIPRNPTYCPSPKKLGFATFISRAPLLTARVSVSRTSQNLCGSNFSFFVSAPTKRGFVVRADANSEAEVSENGGEEEEEVSAAEAEAIAEGEIKAEEAEGIAEGEIKAEDAEVKEPRKPRIKLGDIMGILNKRAVEASEKERPIPDIRTGDIVEIKLEVPQNKRRLSIYKGIVMSRQNAGIHTTIRIRRIIAGVGIEIVFPLYSPNIKEIKVMKHRKVRRARLYYLRDKLPRFSTFK